MQRPTRWPLRSPHTYLRRVRLQEPYESGTGTVGSGNLAKERSRLIRFQSTLVIDQTRMPVSTARQAGSSVYGRPRGTRCPELKRAPSVSFKGLSLRTSNSHECWPASDLVDMRRQGPPRVKRTVSSRRRPAALWGTTDESGVSDSHNKGPRRRRNSRHPDCVSNRLADFASI